MVLVVTGSGTRTARAFESGAATAASLHISYTTGGGGGDPVNDAPVVDAGSAVSVVLPGVASLDGSVVDDGLPVGGSLVSTWSEASGPGEVVFADATAVDTTASFSVAGEYVLRLAATDGELSGSDTVAVSVAPEPGGGGGTVTTVEARVVAGSDDAEQSASGSVNLGSSDLELVADGNTVQTVGVRFAGVQVPAGASVTSAYVQFQTDEVDTGAVSLSVQGQAADNPGTFTSSSGNVSSRARTSAAVAWSPPAWLTVGERGAAQRTPDLSSVVREIVARPGWAGGNAMVLVLTGSGTRTARAFEGSAAAAPVLHVEYTIS